MKHFGYIFLKKVVENLSKKIPQNKEKNWQTLKIVRNQSKAFAKQIVCL